MPVAKARGQRCGFFFWTPSFAMDRSAFSSSHAEEERMHVHVAHPDGEAKFWLDPRIALAAVIGPSPKLRKRRSGRAMMRTGGP